MHYANKTKGIPLDAFQPINVPISLQQPQFLHRTLKTLSKEHIPFDGTTPFFVKSATTYKAFTDIVTSKEELPEDLYVVSSCIELKSEWRTFVHHGKIVGLQNYAGDFLCFPDVAVIEAMIAVYKDAPGAYTLDIGITEQNEVCIIEVHPFVSCGLYGFCNYSLLPVMFIEGYRHFVQTMI